MEIKKTNDVFLTNNFKENEDKFNVLPPERKVRYKLYKIINTIRLKYKLPSFYRDTIGDVFAMSYSNALLNEKFDQNELIKHGKQYHFGCHEYSVSHCVLDYDDEDDYLLESKKRTNYMDFVEEFIQANSLFIEIQSDRDNILNPSFNTIAIGMAFDISKVSIVNVFCHWSAIITKLDLNLRNWTVKLTGKVVNDKYGPYAIRIVNEDHVGKTAMAISFQYLKFDQNTKEFSADFNNDDNPDKMKKQFLEVYLREKPEGIKYGSPCNDKIEFKSLYLGLRIPYEVFPNPIKEKEEEQEDMVKEMKEDENRKKTEESKVLDSKEIERMRVIHEKAIFIENQYN